ncbi:MAG: hypothetical protein AB7K52_07970 [Phycisphaerales bacterium]
MSIEQRHTEIQEGAGLTESRVNREFVDLLKKYSTPVLLIVCVVALGYVGWDRYTKHRQQVLDTAWLDLEKAVQSRSPDSLLAIAQEHAGEKGIPLIARTEAAEVLLNAAFASVRPGAGFKPDGSLEDAEDALSPEQKERQIDRAAEEYAKVLAATQGNGDLAIHRIRALFGLAAIAETRGKWDEAKSRYEEVIAVAKARDLKIGDAAQKLIDTMEEAKTAPRLFADSAIVTRPAAPAAPAAPAGAAPGAPGVLTPIPAPVVVPPAPGSEGLTPAQPLDPQDVSPNAPVKPAAPAKPEPGESKSAEEPKPDTPKGD